MLHLPNLLIRSSGHSVHFLSMTTGEPHPTAELPSLSLPGRGDHNPFYSLSITSCRFAVIMRWSMWKGSGDKVFVWDWTKGKLLLVSEIFFRRTVAPFG